METLKDFRKHLKNGGLIFIDTPCQFWLYPFTSFFSKSIYKKLLRGTVDVDHQQIWTTNSFSLIAKKAGYKIIKYKKIKRIYSAT